MSEQLRATIQCHLSITASQY